MTFHLHVSNFLLTPTPKKLVCSQFESSGAAMSEERKMTKEYLLEHFDEHEMDLSMANISKVPVRELVRR